MDVDAWMRRYGASREVAQGRFDWAKTDAPERAFAAFRMHIKSAKQRGIPFEMTFPEWWAFWTVDGRWEKRGRLGLVMARNGDVGPYAVGNVYCDTAKGNIAAAGGVGGGISRGALRMWARMKAAGIQSHLCDRTRHPRARRIVTPDGEFSSASLAADYFAITANAAQSRARSGRGGWRYAV